MKLESKKQKNSCPDKKMFFLVSTNEVNLEKKEEFIDHILSCIKCRKKFEVINQLTQELEEKITNIPEKSLSKKEQSQLRKLARQKTKVFRKNKGQKLIFGLFPIPYFAAAATILATILTFFLIPVFHDKGESRTGAGEKIVLIEPLGKITQPPYVFSWSPVKGADAYQFKLIDENLNTIFYQAATYTNQILIPENIRILLLKEKTYIWEVLALTDDRRVLDSRSNYFIIE